MTFRAAPRCLCFVHQVVDCSRPPPVTVDDDAAAEGAAYRDLFLVIVEARCDDIQLLGRHPSPEEDGGTALWRGVERAAPVADGGECRLVVERRMVCGKLTLSVCSWNSEPRGRCRRC